MNATEHKELEALVEKWNAKAEQPTNTKDQGERLYRRGLQDGISGCLVELLMWLNTNTTEQ